MLVREEFREEFKNKFNRKVNKGENNNEGGNSFRINLKRETEGFYFKNGVFTFRSFVNDIGLFRDTIISINRVTSPHFIQDRQLFFLFSQDRDPQKRYSKKQINSQKQDSESKKVIQDSHKQNQFRVATEGGFNLEDAKIQTREKNIISPFISFFSNTARISNILITTFNTFGKHPIQNRQFLFLFSQDRNSKERYLQKESTKKQIMANNFLRTSMNFYLT